MSEVQIKIYTLQKFSTLRTAFFDPTKCVLSQSNSPTTSIARLNGYSQPPIMFDSDLSQHTKFVLFL